MTEEIKGLIEKIQQEGIKVAEQKARIIEEEARKRAEELIARAKAEAAKIIAHAEEASKKTEASTQALLRQAARDTILGLRKEINSILDKIMVSVARQALPSQELSRIIHSLIKEYAGKAKGDIVVELKPEDQKALEVGLADQLQKELHQGITLKATEDIQGGFRISFDSGKSHFDFTDKALAEYIGVYLKPKLSSLFEDV